MNVKHLVFGMISRLLFTNNYFYNFCNSSLLLVFMFIRRKKQTYCDNQKTIEKDDDIIVMLKYFHCKIAVFHVHWTF